MNCMGGIAQILQYIRCTLTGSLSQNLPETQEEKRPNILFLQLESFFDPTLVNYLDISEDPIPTFRKLMKEYSSGYYKVPSHR